MDVDFQSTHNIYCAKVILLNYMMDWGVYEDMELKRFPYAACFILVAIVVVALCILL